MNNSNSRNIALLIFCITILFFNKGYCQKIDRTKSEITFSVSNMGFRTVEGTISGMSGDVYFNEEQLSDSYFKVSIDTRTINTENKKRDDHLKNEDFFEVSQFPHISFDSNEIINDGEGFITSGTLTLKGISRQIKIPFQTSSSKDVLLLTGKFTIDRNDYNVGESYGKFMVGYDIEIHVKAYLLLQ